MAEKLGPCKKNCISHFLAQTCAEIKLAKIYDKAHKFIHQTNNVCKIEAHNRDELNERINYGHFKRVHSHAAIKISPSRIAWILK